MLKAIEGNFCTIGEGLREYWCQDPYLRSVVPVESFIVDGFTNSSLKPPYVVYRQSTGSTHRKLGDHFYYDQISASLRIYANEEAWLLGKQTRILLSNLGCIETLEGCVIGTTVAPGAVIRLPSGVNMVEHGLRMSVIEYRGPERLRMVKDGTIV